MMDDNLEQLTKELLNSTSSVNVLVKIGSILNEQNSQSIASFIVKTLPCLTAIEQWAWHMLSSDLQKWTDQPNYSNFFRIVYTFNIKLIANYGDIPLDTIKSLLIPSSIELVDSILNQIELNNDTFLVIVSLWFDTLSHFAFENAEVLYSPVIIHLNDRLGREFLMTKQYKLYLEQLRQPSLPPSTFTPKQLFYLRTCSFSINVYLYSDSQHFPLTSEQILEFLANDYLEIIFTHSYAIDSWSNDLLSCIAHLIGLVCSTCWWGGKKDTRIDMLALSNDTTHSHILALIRIVSHEPFHRCLSISWYTDENLLIDAILIFLIGATDAQNLRSFINAKTNLTTCILSIAQSASYDRISICAYGFLAEILSDEQLRELKIAGNICEFFFGILEQAWRHPIKKWKKIPISYLLKGMFILTYRFSYKTNAKQIFHVLFRNFHKIIL